MPTRFHRLRASLIALLLVMGLVALGYRLYRLQVIDHEKLAQEANRRHEQRIKLPAVRGAISDCNGNILAQTMILRSVAVDPQRVRDLEKQRIEKKMPPGIPEFIRQVGEQLLLPRAEVEEKLSRPSRYIVLKRKVPEETVRALQEALKPTKFGGALIVEDDPMRIYPNGQLMSHVIGYVDSEQRGVDGVELLMQSDLQGQDGWRRIERDRHGREIVVYRDEDFSPRNGYTVVLTLDQAVQNIVEQELDRAVQQYRPNSAVAIVMRPATGEILALANRPTFDPNAPDKQIDSLRNRAVSDLNEPGSTFKIVTVAAALDQRIVALNDIIWCENGKWLHEGRYLHDHEPYGNLSVTMVLVHSSNIGAAKIALMLGDERMWRAMRDFGFGEKAFGSQPTERWPGEVRGIVNPLRQWSKVSITRVAMGHEVAVTPLQMINAMCAIANGGNLMQPQIIKRVVDENGGVVREFFPKVRRRVVDQKAARQVTEALEQVVSKEGTAAKAALAGFKVAGKTGTAWKWFNGQYLPEEYISSFIGFFPADNPELCIYVMLDNPKGRDRYGGSVAAPTFREIALRAASYLNLKPSFPPAMVCPADPTLVPAAQEKRGAR